MAEIRKRRRSPNIVDRRGQQATTDPQYMAALQKAYDQGNEAEYNRLIAAANPRAAAGQQAVAANIATNAARGLTTPSAVVGSLARRSRPPVSHPSRPALPPVQPRGYPSMAQLSWGGTLMGRQTPAREAPAKRNPRRLRVGREY